MYLYKKYIIKSSGVNIEIFTINFLVASNFIYFLNTTQEGYFQNGYEVCVMNEKRCDRKRRLC